jgi:hypothetical protein
MRFILGLLSGVLGLLAGWFGLAMLVVALAGPDRDGGIAMGAFFNVGPIGAVLGFLAGVLLFARFGIVRQTAAPAVAQFPDTEPAVPAAVAVAAPTRVSPAFAVAVLALTGGLAWWGWYELIRSPYLSHGFMKLELQFRLPSGMALPPQASDVHITVTEGGQYAEALLGPAWHGTDGDHRVILAHATLDRKTRQRIVSLELPGVAEQSWQLDLANDPDPTPGYSPWRLSGRNPAVKIEMNFRLSADR